MARTGANPTLLAGEPAVGTATERTAGACPATSSAPDAGIVAGRVCPKGTLSGATEGIGTGPSTPTRVWWTVGAGRTAGVTFRGRPTGPDPGSTSSASTAGTTRPVSSTEIVSTGTGASSRPGLRAGIAATHGADGRGTRTICRITPSRGREGRRSNTGISVVAKGASSPSGPSAVAAAPGPGGGASPTRVGATKTTVSGEARAGAAISGTSALDVATGGSSSRHRPTRVKIGPGPALARSSGTGRGTPGWTARTTASTEVGAEHAGLTIPKHA